MLFISFCLEINTDLGIMGWKFHPSQPRGAVLGSIDHKIKYEGCGAYQNLIAFVPKHHLDFEF